MYLTLIQFISKDKNIEHPILGQLSCSGLQQAYQNCYKFKQKMRQEAQPCKYLYTMSIECYQCKTSEQFQQKIDQQIDERLRLLKFLRSQNSKLPELQKQNSEFNLYQDVEIQMLTDQQEFQQNIQQQQRENKKYL